MFVRRSRYRDVEARCAWLGEQLTETREELADRNTELTRRLETAARPTPAATIPPSAELLQARAHARAPEKRLAEVTAANQACTCGGGAS